jgi:hypothetical protein
VPRRDEERGRLVEERAVVVEPVAVADPDGPDDERERWEREQRERAADDDRDPETLPSDRSRRHMRARSSAAPSTPFEPAGDEDGGGNGGQLEDRERGGGAQVEQPCRLVVDLDLERGVADPPEDDDHAERREAEEEDDRRRGCDGRGEQRRGDSQSPLRRRGAERRGGRFEPGVEPGPERPDHTHDDRDVEEDVCEEDRPDGPLEPVGEEREECGRDDHRRQHERDEDERLDERPAVERESRERPRERERCDERERGRDDREPEGEPRGLERAATDEDVERQVELAVDDQAPLEDRKERPEEEDRQERHRDRDRRDPAGAQRTTISVHRATQRSRFASTSSAGSWSGSRGTIACSTNASGRGTPARTG